MIGITDGVVIKPPQVFRRPLLDFLEILAHHPAALQPPYQPGKGPARVRQHESQLGESIQGAAKNQMRRSNCRFHRITDEVGQVMRREPFMGQHMHRV